MIGARVEERMKAAGLSQAELARRVGMSQQAVHKLIRGSSRSTSNLHKFARELGTSPEYLSGDADDPSLSAQAAPDLAYEERLLVSQLRSLDGGTRSALVKVTAALAGPVAPLPSTNALTRMFEGLLAVVDRSAPPNVLARELAELLPTGLSALSGPLIEGEAALELAKVAAATPAIVDREPAR